MVCDKTYISLSSLLLNSYHSAVANAQTQGFYKILIFFVQFEITFFLSYFAFFFYICLRNIRNCKNIKTDIYFLLIPVKI